MDDREKMSGLTGQAQAKALLENALVVPDHESLDPLQELVEQMYKSKLPSHVVDEFLAERYAEAEREALKL